MLVVIGYITILVQYLYLRLLQLCCSQFVSSPGPTLPSDPTRLPPVYKLPLDIVYYIGANRASDLSPADQASLALVCKCFWEILNGPRLLRRLQRQTPAKGDDDGEEKKNDRLDFLSRLERRFPKHLLCHQCTTFHRRGPRRWGRIPDMPILDCDMQNGVFIPYYPLLPFTWAQEVMNRHRHGAKYGYPIADIEFNLRVRPCYQPQARHRLRARIIDNELVVEIDRSKLFHRTSREQKEDAVFVLRAVPFDCPSIHYSGIYQGTLLEEESACVSVKCRRCWRETRYIVDPAYDAKHGEIRCTTWFNLGPCTNPMDAKWHRATTSCRDRSLPVHPAELRYLQFFDDVSPQRVPEKTPARIYSYMAFLRTAQDQY